MARRSTGSKMRFSPTPRRKRVWTHQVTTDSAFAEDALRSENLLVGYEAAGGSIQGVTVVRTIITLVWSTTDAGGAGDSLVVGLIKGTETAADVADPVGEPFADWAWNFRYYSGDGHGLVTAGAPNVITIDAHSSRKIDEVGESWWLIYRFQAPTVVTTATVRAQTRCLLLLP